MRPKKKVERAKEGLLDWLEKVGVDKSTIANLDTTAIPERTFAKSLEAEGILLTLQSVRLPVKAKICKNCGEAFATNYMYVGYCSDHCRAKAIEKITGIRWDPTKSPEQRWGGEDSPTQIPLVISPEAIERLRAFLAQVDDLAGTANPNSDSGTQRSPVENKSVLTPGAIHRAIDQVYSGDPLYRNIRDSMGLPGWSPTPEAEQKVEQEESAENTNHQPSPVPNILDTLRGPSAFSQQM